MHEQIIRRSDAPSSPLFSQAIKVGTGGREASAVPRTDHYNGMAGRSRTP